jgi:hypothetical protein
VIANYLACHTIINIANLFVMRRCMQSHSHRKLQLGLLLQSLPSLSPSLNLSPAVSVAAVPPPNHRWIMVPYSIEKQSTGGLPGIQQQNVTFSY